MLGSSRASAAKATSSVAGAGAGVDTKMGAEIGCMLCGFGLQVAGLPPGYCVIVYSVVCICQYRFRNPSATGSNKQDEPANYAVASYRIVPGNLPYLIRNEAGRSRTEAPAGTGAVARSEG